ncbi:hypothetical protein A3Q56_06856, partial [Intoshia linei]
IHLDIVKSLYHLISIEYATHKTSKWLEPFDSNGNVLFDRRDLEALNNITNIRAFNEYNLGYRNNTACPLFMNMLTNMKDRIIKHQYNEKHNVLKYHCVNEHALMGLYGLLRLVNGDNGWNNKFVTSYCDKVTFGMHMSFVLKYNGDGTRNMENYNLGLIINQNFTTNWPHFLEDSKFSTIYDYYSNNCRNLEDINSLYLYDFY